MRTWPFALLCIAASAAWLLPDSFPQIRFDLRSAAIACALATTISLLFVRAPRQPITRSLLWPCIGGALVLVGPASASFLHATGVSSGALTIALALTPVAVAVASPALSNEELPANHLWPGILAAAALLLAIPAPSLRNARSDAALLLAPLLTGLGCILYKRSDAPAPRKAACSFGLAAILFATGAGIHASISHNAAPVSFAAAGIDAVLFLLALLALQRLAAIQYTARYALVPLLLLLEGPALFWPITIHDRNALCGILLLVATIAMLRSRTEENVPKELLGSN